MKPRGVLLDVDGTLVDSNDAHAHAWIRALADNGRAVPFEKVRRLIGMGGDKLLVQVAGIDEEAPEGKKISKRRGEIFKDEYLPSLKPFAGAIDLLERMRSRDVRLVAASSAKRDELQAILKVCGADRHIELQTSSDDADKSKPDPDILQAALGKLRITASEAVMLGDTPFDVAAAQRAGIRMIAVRCGGWSDADLVGAVAIYDGPQDLLMRYDASPLAG